jgi:hypothetical protein
LGDFFRRGRLGGLLIRGLISAGNEPGEKS